MLILIKNITKLNNNRFKLLWSKSEILEALISSLKKKVSSVDFFKLVDDDDNISPPA